MGTVVTHADMGKAGSSSIQAWLAGDLPALRERGIELLTARRDPEDHRFVRLRPYRRGRIHANRLVVHYEVQGADRRALIATSSSSSSPRQPAGR